MLRAFCQLEVDAKGYMGVNKIKCATPRLVCSSTSQPLFPTPLCQPQTGLSFGVTRDGLLALGQCDWRHAPAAFLKTLDKKGVPSSPVYGRAPVWFLVREVCCRIWMSWSRFR
jgi:hypothetical protein